MVTVDSRSNSWTNILFGKFIKTQIVAGVNYDAGTSYEAEHHAEALRLAEVQPGQHVLDVACGTGRATVGPALFNALLAMHGL